MENVDGAQFVFIGGVPRSGTSIFQKILDGHTQIYGGPEFDHIYPTLKLYQSYKNGVEVTKRQKHYYTEKDVLLRFRAFLNEFLEAKLNQEMVSYLSEKTPSNLLVFHQLKEFFPNSKFIWVIRDPRANLYSFNKVQKQNKETNLGKNLYQDLNLINRYIKSGTRFSENYPESILIIYYEDLLLNTESEILKVCEFLSLPYENNMLNTNRKNDMSELAESNVSHTRGFVSKELISGNFENKNVDDWHSKLSKTDLVLSNYYISKFNFHCYNRYSIKKPSKVSFVFHWFLKNGLKRLFGKAVN